VIKYCAVCGKPFPDSPSNNRVTCSKECSTIRKHQTHLGKSNIWSDESRQRQAEKGQTENLKLGTAAALNDPLNQRGPQNRNAMTWTLLAPDGEIHTVVNLLDWARLHTEDYFGMEATDENARVIASGIRNIKRSMEDKLRRANGKPYSVTQYKGWQLLGWK